MIYKQLRQGFTLIEMIIAIFISTLIFSALVVLFQNFTNFHTWLVNFSFMQKQSTQEISFLEEQFSSPQSIIEVEERSAFLNGFLTRKVGTLQYNAASLVENKDGGEQISILNTKGYLAMHSGIVFGGMVQVGTDLFIVDTGNHVIRKIDLLTSSSSVYAGTLGTAGADNAADSLSATFRNPTGIAYYNNTLYLSDTGNHSIRQIVMNASSANRTVTTFAGVSGSPGNSDGLATTSFLNTPTGIAINQNSGDVYIADTGNHIVKKVTVGLMVSVIGTGGIAGEGANNEVYSNFLSYGLNTPTNLFYDEHFQSLYINDFLNKRILKLEEGLKVVKITNQDEYYGGMSAYTDDLSRNYLLFQTVDRGDIFAFDLIDYSISELLGHNDVSNYDAENYLSNSFIKDGETYYMWGVAPATNSWTLTRVNSVTDNVYQWYGDVGAHGFLKLWDHGAHIYSTFSDHVGANNIGYFVLRQDPAEANNGRHELLIRYEQGDVTDDTLVSLRYSLILGDEK